LEVGGNGGSDCCWREEEEEWRARESDSGGGTQNKGAVGTLGEALVRCGGQPARRGRDRRPRRWQGEGERGGDGKRMGDVMADVILLSPFSYFNFLTSFLINSKSPISGQN
jgi:hypothetical protein